MKVVIAPPPNYEEVLKHFDVEKDSVIFTYGDTIYNPKDIKLADHVLVHEHVHTIQQGDHPARWWDMYFNSPTFRLEQELEAYRAQWQFVNNGNYTRKQKDKFLDDIAGLLSSHIYGNIINYQQAHAKVRRT
jgi:acetyltransferase-like isoleucine patch superfamily enzyme